MRAEKLHMIIKYWEVFFMVQLNATTLPSISMTRGVAPKRERVIQFGEGGFCALFVTG